MNLVWTKPTPPARPSRRDELIEMAAALFAERGFAGVTVDDIGAALGISGPALYHHFKSKEALLGEMLVTISEHLLARGQAIAVATAPPDERLRRLIADHAEFAVDRIDLITVQYRDLVHAPVADQRRVRRLQRSYVELWVDALGTANRRADNARVLAVFGMLNSTPHSARLGRDDMKALLVEMAAAALGL
jgi:AcrR family transcriptional regulator